MQWPVAEDLPLTLGIFDLVYETLGFPLPPSALSDRIGRNHEGGLTCRSCRGCQHVIVETGPGQQGRAVVRRLETLLEVVE